MRHFLPGKKRASSSEGSARGEAGAHRTTLAASGASMRAMPGYCLSRKTPNSSVKPRMFSSRR